MGLQGVRLAATHLAVVLLCFVATGRAVKVVDGDTFDASLVV